GTIDLTSEANNGVSFTDAQIKALGSDFNFVPASEKELPTPTLADAGKVVAVNETGTEYELVESGGALLVLCEGEAEYVSEDYLWRIPTNATITEINDAMRVGRGVNVMIPYVFDSSPYYEYRIEGSFTILSVFSSGPNGADLAMPSNYNVDNITGGDFDVDEIGTAILELWSE
ncbi:MAG: hypothetical protein J6Y88_02085, partial [Bacteroidales bacterium]|nr:hypothetical protein [Bacteroidales bacterium]